MFYSNALAKATSGARKKAHGGSGISGDGNAYSPSSAYSISVRSIHAHITFTLSCCFLGVPSCTLRFPSSRIKVLMDTLHTSHWRPSYMQRIKTKKIHSSLRMNCIITMFAAMYSTNRLMPEQVSGGMSKAELELNEYVNLCWIGVEIDLFNMIMISTCLALLLLQRFRDS